MMLSWRRISRGWASSLFTLQPHHQGEGKRVGPGRKVQNHVYFVFKEYYPHLFYRVASQIYRYSVYILTFFINCKSQRHIAFTATNPKLSQTNYSKHLQAHTKHWSLIILLILHTGQS